GYRLMAELMYGAGLRLLELLRLRVHHLDLERGQVQVYSGKGGRVNGFANAVNARQAASDALHLRAAIGI
ncbi:MAG: tyrosine-type recombinase/integrase, partial [Opitutaceae bacterium]|nr:tyrosine-type recombinase/integrase [Opitutaceae bacterium]MBP9913264.1 tyrosine-type recombinase/integrase [Opitutaceae bacterium]